jgi:hypothetical protein
MFDELRWACVAVFTAAIPLLVIARFKAKLPVWLLILLTTALSWFLPYAHMSMRGPMIRRADRELAAIREEYQRHPETWPTTHNPDGNTNVENPFFFGDFVPTGSGRCA